MTTAPANLLAVRSMLLEYLDVQPTSPSADLEPAEVGIVGDPAHRGGYHCGKDRVDGDDYSVRDSPRDKAGLTIAASALDIGWFEVRSRGAVHNLRTFSVWCVGQCRAKAPDTRDIREIIYSPDGKVVRRYDATGRQPNSGDSTHTFHTHFSFFRDATKAGRDQRPLFRRYLSAIGLLEGDDMNESQDYIQHVMNNRLNSGIRLLRETITIPAHGDHEAFTEPNELAIRLNGLEKKLDAIAATPPGTAAVSDEQLERVLRKVIGSVG